MAADEKIKVVVRVRKLIDREKEQAKAFGIEDATKVIQKSTKRKWTFDRVYSPLDNNRTVYADTAAELIEATMLGFNSTIFAYGQTSSGKTHTMHGSKDEVGVVQLAVDQLFYAIEETPDRRFLMQVAFMEIYNETVIDLLSDPKTRPAGGLKVRENDSGEVFVEGLEQKIVVDAKEILDLMKLGEKSRHIGETKMNDRSSRSHTIFRMILESTNRITDETMTEDEQEEADEGKQVMISQLNLVDLAGSERAAQTGAAGQRLKEGCNINQSLMRLGQVISKLSTGSKHINYRDSKLTRILQNSIGGNAKTAIVCTVTPAAMSEEQTLSTLRFASQAKVIENHVKVNEVLDDQARINRLMTEMAGLQKELEEQRALAKTDMVAEMREQLERERKEKEDHMLKIRDLQEKMLVSTQPAPPRKSMMQVKKKERRETWCGPAMRKTMRMSVAPSKLKAPFQFPLQPFNLKLNPPAEDVEDASISNASLSSVDFNMSAGILALDLDEEERNKLEDLKQFDEEDDLDQVFPVVPEKRKKKERRTVKFLESPIMFTPSPKRPYLDLTTENETPRAVIRDKFKRVSSLLSDKSVELQKKDELLSNLEQEHKELQEFTRLEVDTGVDQARKHSTASWETDSSDRIKFLEKSFNDAEALNFDLTKDLAQSKLDHQELMAKFNILEQDFQQVSMAEKSSSTQMLEAEGKLEILLKEQKVMKERNIELEGFKLDAEMTMELALAKKEDTVKDLRKYLESAYEEIATHENGNVVDVKNRAKKVGDLTTKVEELTKEVLDKQKLIDEAQAMTGELEHLKEGMEVLTSELDKIASEKVDLEKEVEALKKASVVTDIPDADERQRLEFKVKELEVKSSNLELSNMSLLETVDDLSKKSEELAQNNSELLVNSGEVDRFNVELREEIALLKVEVKSLTESMVNIEAENCQLKVEIEDAKNAKSDLEDFINKSSNNEEIDELKNELKKMEDDKLVMEKEIAAKDQVNKSETVEVLNKLSETLVNIEESFIQTDEGNKTAVDFDSPCDNTFANMTLGVPLSVVEEIKNQLVTLQHQLIEADPERIKAVREENDKLKSLLFEASSSEKAHIDEVEEIKKKHQVEISLVTTKMREEINLNLPVLEEKLAMEFEERKIKEMSDIRTKHDREIKDLEAKVRASDDLVSKLTEQLSGMSSNNSLYVTSSETPSTPMNGTEAPASLMEELAEAGSAVGVVSEISFDETLGSDNMSLTLLTSHEQTTTFVGDSLQIQILQQELDVAKADIERKNLEIEELASKNSEYEQNNFKSTPPPVETIDAGVTEGQAEAELKLTDAFKEKEELKVTIDGLQDQLENVEKLKSEVCQLNSQLAKEKESLLLSDMKTSKLQDEMEQMEETLESAIMEKESSLEQLSLAEEKATNLESKMGHLESQMADLESGQHEANKHAEQKLTDALKEKEELKVIIDNFKEQLTVEKLKIQTDAENEIEVFKKTASEFESQLSNANHLLQEKEKAQIDASELHAKLLSLHESNEKLTVSNDNLELQLIRRTEEKESLNTLLKEEEKLKQCMENEMRDMQVSIEKMQESVTEKGHETDLLKNAVQAVESSKQSMKIEAESVTAELSTVKKENLDLQEKVLDLERGMEEYKNTCEEAISRASSNQGEYERLEKERNSAHEQLRFQSEENLLKLRYLSEAQQKVTELEETVERLKFDVGEIEKQRDIVDAECDRLESKLEETQTMLDQSAVTNSSKASSPEPVLQKMKELEAERDRLMEELQELMRQMTRSPTEEKYLGLKSQLIQQKNYSDNMYKHNVELKKRLGELENKASEETKVELERELTRVKEELGKKNVEFASLKVDVERGELEYKKKCSVVESDLEYEKANNVRLTQEIRRYQSSAALDSTVCNPRAKPSSATITTTSSAAEKEVGSPVWSSGSGAIKEIQLHNAEQRVKVLEKENQTLKEHEEFYINKGREWKNRALKYEKKMEKAGLVVPGKENKVSGAEQKEKEGGNKLAVQPLQEKQDTSAVTPTEDLQLVLTTGREERTRSDLYLPEATRSKKDDCKTQ